MKNTYPSKSLMSLRTTSLSDEDQPVIWRRISDTVFLENFDSNFWWRTAGYALALLLRRAGYTAESQYQHLIFFAHYVVPELGPAPNSPEAYRGWKSFMTDDHTPIEISWDWGVTGSRPTIRYSIEPIGKYAGSSKDPLNQYSGPRLIRELSRSVPGVSSEWFEHFSKEFLIFDGPSNEGHESRFFAAFDLYQNQVTVKAYFFPAFRALKTGQSRLAVLSEAFTRLPQHCSYDFHGFDVLRSYMQDPTISGSMTVEMLAIDCIAPAESRLKIYIRSRSTSFESVKAVMTLAGRLNSPNLVKGLEELQILWNLLFRPSDFPTEELEHVKHRTAGMLYNFEIKPDGSLPVPKIYIPVRHYARNDLDVLQGLQIYLQRVQRDSHSVDQYLQAVSTLFSHQYLEGGFGAHTYLGCAIKNGSLRLVSYINPQCSVFDITRASR